MYGGKEASNTARFALFADNTVWGLGRCRPVRTAAGRGEYGRSAAAAALKHIIYVTGTVHFAGEPDVVFPGGENPAVSAGLIGLIF